MLVQLPSLSPGAYGGAAAAALSLDEVIYSEDGQIDATTDVFTTTNTLSSSYDFTFIIVYGFAQPPHSMTISGTTVNSIAENQGVDIHFSIQLIPLPTKTSWTRLVRHRETLTIRLL